ncbi:MAG: ATP--dephospho-CoA triphosphoribosyl transferase CitG [Thermoprotei archaeon]|nr:MAG: ATP--dephospho-CoA triphosphoribosyl transferase CitG [Thermoprotei archaeon]
MYMDLLVMTALNFISILHTKTELAYRDINVCRGHWLSKRLRGLDPYEVMVKAQLAALLEVSAHPKPGNIHRFRDRWGKRFEHFIAGAVALGPPVREAFTRGLKAWSRGQLSLIGLGRLVRIAVEHQLKAHSGGNTHLGVIMLFIPIAASAPAWINSPSPSIIERALVEVLRATTPKDSVELLKAVRKLKPSGLGKPPKGLPDASKSCRTDLSMYELLKASSKWDGVARELVEGLPVTLSVGLPSLLKTYEETGDVNTAVVQCFLEILSRAPDTLIARNVGLALKPNSTIDEAVQAGMAEASWVSEKAREALALGGMLTSKGRRFIEKLDLELESRGPSYNPGTTADITASSIFVALLMGRRLI